MTIKNLQPVANDAHWFAYFISTGVLHTGVTEVGLVTSTSADDFEYGDDAAVLLSQHLEKVPEVEYDPYVLPVKGFYAHRDMVVKLRAVDIVDKPDLYTALEDKWNNGFYYDCGPAGSPLTAGYDRLGAASDWWQADCVDLIARDRETGSDLRRDLILLASGTLVMPITNGLWDVVIKVGDRTSTHQNCWVTIQETEYALPDTDAAEFKNLTVNGVSVSDNTMTLFFEDKGGGTPKVGIVAMEFVPQTS